MESDTIIRQLVAEELDHDPSVTADGIGVAVADGVVTLSGHVASYPERFAAVRAAQRVRGVKAVAQDLLVRLPNLKKRADDEIAGRAISILNWTLHGIGNIKVTVDGGWVTLAGRVDSSHQKKDAERAIRLLGGVTGVSNEITVKTSADPVQIGSEIRKAFRRAAHLDGAGISVTVDGSTVTLIGRVKDWHERRAAEDAAWTAPGVNEVIDRLTVDYLDVGRHG
ncbi:Osmotically-inducible protein OsmY, contains BON domain [uncultured Defluviicoccus sp.]|uniref:Osmotically-inducible protein OsmY, contains BON domain n=1 Tax=metagenome TaxID=256318 RepID=A0A380T9L4_9ZZZZ|nr:Osmotically-inducible protein OsmY, contains BON domain [uncultured Defluviicoccus sp.]